MKGSSGEVASSPFLASSGHLHSLACGRFLPPPVSVSVILFHLSAFSFCVVEPPSLSISKDSCDDTETTQIIQDSLPTSRFLTRITAKKFPLPYKGTFMGLGGEDVDILWGEHYSADHSIQRDLVRTSVRPCASESSPDSQHPQRTCKGHRPTHVYAHDLPNLIASFFTWPQPQASLLCLNTPWKLLPPGLCTHCSLCLEPFTLLLPQAGALLDTTLSVTALPSSHSCI